MSICSGLQHLIPYLHQRFCQSMYSHAYCEIFAISLGHSIKLVDCNPQEPQHSHHKSHKGYSQECNQPNFVLSITLSAYRLEIVLTPAFPPASLSTRLYICFKEKSHSCVYKQTVGIKLPSRYIANGVLCFVIAYLWRPLNVKYNVESRTCNTTITPPMINSSLFLLSNYKVLSNNTHAQPLI